MSLGFIDGVPLPKLRIKHERVHYGGCSRGWWERRQTLRLSLIVVANVPGELPGNLIARSNGTGHDPVVPTWVFYCPRQLELQGKLQNDQFAAVVGGRPGWLRHVHSRGQFSSCDLRMPQTTEPPKQPPLPQSQPHLVPSNINARCKCKVGT